MKIKKFIIAVFLAAYIAFLLIFGVSCSKNGNNGNNGNEAEKTMTSDAAAEAVATTIADESGRRGVSDGLETVDYKGKKFRILHRDNQQSTGEITAELAETGDIINDAVYRRNMTVKERFNVNIVSLPLSEPDLVQSLKNSVASGDDAYDLVVSHMISMADMATSGYFLNWYSVPNINFEQPWWSAGATKELTIDRKSFFALSDICYTAISNTYCYYFNKRLAAEYGVSDPYQVVRDGKWTIDYVMNAVKGIYKDLNNDNEPDCNDFYGFVTNANSAAVTYLWAFDNPVTKYGADGLPEMAINTQKMPSIVEKLYSFFFETPGVYAFSVKTKSDLNWWDYSADAFKNGRAVFAAGMFGDAVTNFRGTEDFGILPYPKWDENQTEYYTMMDGGGPLMAIPVTAASNNNDSLDFIGRITEALSAESWKEVTPAYYEIALKVKFTRDDESVGMLDMILGGRRFDFGYVYDGWKGVAFALAELLYSQNKNYTSWYSAREHQAQKRYESIIDYYKQYEY